MFDLKYINNCMCVYVCLYYRPSKYTAYLMKYNELEIYYIFAPYFRHIYIYILEVIPRWLHFKDILSKHCNSCMFIQTLNKNERCFNEVYSIISCNHDYDGSYYFSFIFIIIMIIIVIIIIKTTDAGRSSAHRFTCRKVAV